MHLDDTYLDTHGLAALPAEHRASLLAELIDTLHLRVGTVLGEGMTSQQMQQFCAIEAGDAEAIAAWNAELTRIRHQRGDLSDDATVPSETHDDPATAWLAHHRPDYRDVVRSVAEQLSTELRAIAPTVLARLTDTAMTAAPGSDT